MNATLVLTLVRQRLASPLRMIVLAFVAGFPLLGAVLSPGGDLSSLGDSYVITLVLAAGLIGQDVASGSLQLVLARPVTRPTYVMSRWAGATLAAIVVVAAQLAFAAFVLSARGFPPAPAVLVRVLAQAAVTSAGTAAVLTLASSLATGLGDLALLLAASLVGWSLGGIGQMRAWPWLARAGQEVLRFTAPRLDLAAMMAGEVSWFDVTSYASTVTICLLLAMVVINRRELSYAAA